VSRIKRKTCPRPRASEGETPEKVEKSERRPHGRGKKENGPALANAQRSESGEKRKDYCERRAGVMNTPPPRSGEKKAKKIR